MPIHTAPADKIEYVRIIRTGEIGKVLWRKVFDNHGDEIMFIGTPRGFRAIYVIKAVEFITKKEYFIGVLNGR